MIWFVIVALVAISFFFAGIEAGLLSVDSIRLRHQVKLRAPDAIRLARLLERPERLLVTVLLLTKVADITALLLATRELVNAFGTAGYFITLAAAIPIHLFLLGVLPKSLFRRFSLRALAGLGGILETASLVLWPILEVGHRIGRLLFPKRPFKQRRLFAAREELKHVMVIGEREGSLTATERAMIHSVVDYRNVRARDVMVPLEKCVTLRPETPVEEALQLSSTSGRERFPVVSRDGEAVGLVSVFDILLDDAPAGSLARYTRRIVTAGENDPAYAVIRRLRAARLRLAAVLDERRKLIGIAIDEELIKRLVQSA